MKADRSQAGLTLVETLVALAILALVSLSSYALLSQSARFSVAEQERLLAGVIADNLMVETLARRAAPPRGEREGENTLAGRTFAWTVAAVDAPEGLIRIEISVRRAGEERILARVECLRGET